KGGYVRATMTLALLLGVAGAAIGANFVKYGASDYWTDTGDLVIAGDITSVGLTASGTNLVFSGIATSTNGLTSGMLYSNSGVVTVF
ncbi:MAG: hypothetical protein GWN80_11480, partial [Gammaproteobacteria bacterium]|nr:hypothetical protein [Gammaproteobacteria bacterium]